ncbi:MAG: Acetyl-coenzyme A carboxylase carboxyl transferase subunit beta [Lachnoclostridium sp.]
MNFKKCTSNMAGLKQVQLGDKVKNSLDEAQIPDGLFEKCNKCNEIVYTEDVVANYYICPNCGNYFRITPRTRISMILDKGSFTEWDEELAVSDPLNFPGYQSKLELMKMVTSLDEAVVTGQGKIDDLPVAIGVMAANFLMGSMGKVVGEKLTRMIERATNLRIPVIIFCCSGGARMQEGIVSLMQMAKTSQALKKHDEAGLLYISVLTDPTTGGVMASFAMLGDVILAEPGALIGFAGPRVIEQTIGQRLPEGFQSAEFLLEHGFIDKIVKRNKLKSTLSMLIKS